MTLEKNSKISVIKTISIFIFVFLSVKCYGFFFESYSMKSILFVLSIFITLISLGGFLHTGRDFYQKLIKCMIVSMLLTFITSMLFWGQSPVLTFRVSYSLFYLFAFFYLSKYNLPLDTIEKIIVLFGLIYSVIWVYAMVFNPLLVIERYDGDVDTSRGMARFRLAGSCLLYMAYFISLNKFFVKKNLINLLLVTLFFFMIFFQLTRQIIAITFIVTLFYVFHNKIKWLVGLLVSLICLIHFSKDIDPSSIQLTPVRAMVELTMSQAEENESEENIRITAYKYFFSSLSPNVVTDLFGSSFPHTESPYGVKTEKLSDQGLFLSDVGYAQIFVTTGFVGLVLYLLLFGCSFFVKLPKEYMYAKLYMIFMALCTIATDYYSSVDGQMTIAISAYIFMVKRKQQLKFNFV